MLQEGVRVDQKRLKWTKLSGLRATDDYRVERSNRFIASTNETICLRLKRSAYVKSALRPRDNGRMIIKGSLLFLPARRVGDHGRRI